MSALALYDSLSTPARKLVRTATLHAIDPKRSRVAWRDSEASAEDDHPALVVSLREWWHTTATTEEVCAVIDATKDQRAMDLAVLVCAEACAHYVDDARVAECHRVRLAWARGEATDKQRDAAWDAARDAARGTLAGPLRALYPDPSRIEHFTGLLRYDAAVAVALGLPEFRRPVGAGGGDVTLLSSLVVGSGA